METNRSPYFFRGGNGWTTEDEKEFLDQMRTWTVNREPMPNSILYENYITAAHNRSDWGEIDKVQVLFHAYQRLSEARQKERDI